MNLLASLSTWSLMLTLFSQVVVSSLPAMGEMYLFTDHPELVNEFLNIYPHATATDAVLNRIVGISSNTMDQPMLNTLLTILNRPNSGIHKALFHDRCRLYRDLKLMTTHSISHLDAIALFEQSPSFHLSNCRVHLLCQRIENATTLDEMTALVEADLEIGNLTHENIHILTDFVMNDDVADKLSTEAFNYLTYICGRLDIRLQL